MTSSPKSPPTPVTHLIVASDHGGYSLKVRLKEFMQLKSKRLEIIDVGNCGDKDSCDYPDLALKGVERYVETVMKQQRSDSESDQKSKNSNSNVICLLVCGSGIGISIAANKYLAQAEKLYNFKFDSCAMVHDVTTARFAYQEMGSRCFSLGGRITGGRVAEEICEVLMGG